VKPPAEGQTVEGAVADYQTQRKNHVEFSAKLSELLAELLRQEPIEYQAIEQRAKTVESLRDKLTRPAKRYENGLSDITDLSGLRIITYTLSEATGTCALVQREFKIIPQHSVDKGALLAPAEFGYRFRHYVAELGATRFELAEWKRFSGLRFEIQIRTVLEHAWAAIDHALRYKREADVPREQKRVLFRLSALLELADENFDSLKRGQTLLSQDAENRIDNRDDTLELNIVTYAAYARTSIALQDLANLMYSAGFRRPEELDLPPSNDDSHAIAIAQLSGIRTISDLDGALNDEKSVALKYFTALARSPTSNRQAKSSGIS